MNLAFTGTIEAAQLTDQLGSVGLAGHEFACLETSFTNLALPCVSPTSEHGLPSLGAGFENETPLRSRQRYELLIRGPDHDAIGVPGYGHLRGLRGKAQ